MTRIPSRPALVAPAGNLASLDAALRSGADAVYMGLKNRTNARHFAGLNLQDDDLAVAARRAHALGKSLYLAVNTYIRGADAGPWYEAVDRAAAVGADAVIAADLAVLAYAARRHPQLRRHLSVQASASNREAISFYVDEYGISRVVLPRVLTLAQIARIVEGVDAEVEVFGFGSLCVMAEGRCLLSSYATGEAPNTQGACSPARFVRWEETPRGMEARLNGVLIDRFDPDEPAGYPTLCKGRFQVDAETYYALEEPVSLNAIDVIPELINAGVAAIKVEGRQRSPAYVGDVTRTLSAAIDAAWAANQRGDGGFKVETGWRTTLERLSEGQQETLGAYDRPWR